MMPGNERRPQGDLEATESFGGDDFNSATDRRSYRRKHWAFPLIRRGGANLPAYGSDEWLALPENSPIRIASCVRAAETWAQQGDNLVAELREEVEQSRIAYKRTEDQDYVARREAHRKEWRHLRSVRTFPWNERQSGPDGGAA